MIIYGKYTSINWFVESGVAWFALAMFFMYIITFYTKRFKPVYVFVLSVVIAMILGYTGENTDIFCWMRIVYFYPFFSYAPAILPCICAAFSIFVRSTEE